MFYCMLQTMPPTVPFLPLPGMTTMSSRTTPPGSIVPTASYPASSVASAGSGCETASSEQKTTTEELPLWIETKTSEGKVSRGHWAVSKGR